MNSPASSQICPHCSRSTATPFGNSGVCLLCAGQRALTLDLEATDPFASVAPEAGPTSRSPFSGDLPERIGPYAIIDEIGRGGMARVFVARQPRLDRLVALKVLSGPAASSDLAARFLREANTVARLRHPNIIALHDSGRADGAIYFAMDYVEGGDLAARLRAQPFVPIEAADLIRKVALALAYAHRQGVLHRDLKPSNVLLDGDEPMLADFGLAAELEDGGDLTRISSVLGTPHYLAPETVTGGSAAASVASDLYSLGVVLYEMLAGRTPFAGATVADIVARRASEEAPPLRQFASAVPRDLETICLKCLARDPARRYADADALAEDLRRYLAGETILARQPSLFERASRFARRHRLLVAASGAAGLALAAGATVSTILTIRATRAERRAAQEAAAARAVVDFLKDDMLAQAAPDRQPDPDVKLRTVLERASATIGPRLASQPEIEVPLREVLGVTYTGIGQYPVAQQHLERALALARGQFGPEDPRALQIENELASNLVYLRKNDEAEAAKKRVLEICRRVLGPEQKATLNIASDLAAVYAYENKLPEAEALLRDTIAGLERGFGPLDRDTLNSRTTLGLLLMRQGRLQDAAAFTEETLRRIRQVAGNEAEQTLNTLTALAGIYGRLGTYEKAVPLLEEAVATGTKTFGEENQMTLNAMNTLAAIFLRQRRFDEAAVLLDRVYRSRLRLLGPTHAATLNTEVSLATLHREQGRLDEAIRLYTEVRNVRTRDPGPEHPDTLRIVDLLGTCRLEQGRLPEALELHREALNLRRKALGETHYETLDSVRNVVEDHLRLGAADAAARIAEQALPFAEKAQPDTWQTALLHCRLGIALARLGRLDEAASHLQPGASRLLKEPAQIPAIARQKVVREVQAYQQEFSQARHSENAASGSPIK